MSAAITSKPGRFRTRGASLGIAIVDPPGLIAEIDRGFPFKSLQELEARSGIAASAIAEVIGIPPRTLARRKATGKLSPLESERLLRIATVFEKAVALFEGDGAAATEWLTSPQKALGRQTPLSYTRTETGAREVENLIGRLEHGVFS